jgi:hypothetical protein
MGNSTKRNGHFLSYICGKLLGDGCITIQSGRKPRFQFIHAASDFEWCNYCYQELSSYIPLNPPKYRKIKDSRVLKGFTESYVIQSRTADIITYLESIWYQERKKIIPFDYLEKYLNERTLAWWYLDDGHLKINNGIPKKIILSTDNFTSYENQLLIKLLEQKYSLFFSLDGQNRLVLYDQLQIYYFYRLVEPFLHHSMARKMIVTVMKSKLISSKRTTLYLPQEISLLKPTQEINEMLNYLPELYEIVKDRKSYLYHYRKYVYPIRKMENTKSFQIIIEEKYRPLLLKIRNFTGLNNSQIAALCFTLSDL